MWDVRLIFTRQRRDPAVFSWIAIRWTNFSNAVTDAEKDMIFQYQYI